MTSTDKKTIFTPTLKGFLGGTVIGAIAIAIVGFNAGWIVTTDAMNRNVEEASVNVQASICAAGAMAHLTATNDTVDLEGYRSEASNAREVLAKEFAVALPGQDQASSEVITACGRMLNQDRS